MNTNNPSRTRSHTTSYHHTDKNWMEAYLSRSHPNQVPTAMQNTLRDRQNKRSNKSINPMDNKIHRNDMANISPTVEPKMRKKTRRIRQIKGIQNAITTSESTKLLRLPRDLTLYGQKNRPTTTNISYKPAKSTNSSMAQNSGEHHTHRKNSQTKTRERRTPRYPRFSTIVLSTRKKLQHIKFIYVCG